MGLLDAFGLGSNPFVSWLDQNRNTIGSAFGGLSGASNLHDALGGWTNGINNQPANAADQAAVQAQQQQAKDAGAVQQQQQQQNMTIAALKKAGRQDLIDYVNATGDIKGAFNQLLSKPTGPIKAAPGDVFLDPQTYKPIATVPGGDRSTTPAGYRWTSDGQKLEPIPGGPSDPNSAQAISPEALDLIATQYLAGDKSAITGYARNANMRAQIANAVALKANQLGMDGKAIAAEISSYGGNVAAQRAAGTRAAQVGMAASEASQMADIALQASAAVPRGSFVPWNKAVNAFRTGTSTPEMAAFVTATTSLVNAYARAVSPLGAPTDAMRQHAELMLNTAQGPEAYAAVIAQMKREMEAALNAPAEISSSLKTSITGPSPSAGTADDPPDGVDAATWQYMTPEERALWQN